MLVSSLTRIVLSSDQRRVARLREPVRNRSPSCSFPLISAGFQAVEPLRATSILPSFSTTTQVRFSAARDTAGRNAAKSTVPASAVNLAGTAAPYFDRKLQVFKTDRLRVIKDSCQLIPI